MKNKRVNKSKAEVLDGLKKNQDFQKKMVFVKEKFYPALCEAATSIDDASTLLSGFNTMIMQEFLALMKDKKVEDLNLKDKLDPESEKLAENHKLLELFYGMSVFEAKDILEGMRSEIALFQQEEMKERPLSTLKTKWVDEM